MILIRCSDDFGSVWIHGIYDKAKGIEVFEAVLDFQSRQRRFGGVVSVPAGKEGS